MTFVAGAVVILVNTLALFLVLLGLPGIWLMVGVTAVCAWWQWNSGLYSAGLLVAIIVLATLGELLEFAAGMAGAKRAGSSRRGAMGAVVGGIAGAIVGTVLIPMPVAGSLMGGCAGAGIGAWSCELAGGRDRTASIRAGVGAGLGTLTGRLIKLGVAAVIWVAVVVATFWP